MGERMRQEDGRYKVNNNSYQAIVVFRLLSLVSCCIQSIIRVDLNFLPFQLPTFHLKKREFHRNFTTWKADKYGACSYFGAKVSEKNIHQLSYFGHEISEKSPLWRRCPIPRSIHMEILGWSSHYLFLNYYQWDQRPSVIVRVVEVFYLSFFLWNRTM